MGQRGLVSLLGVTDACWDRAQPPARPVRVTVTLPRYLKYPVCWAASPEHGLTRLPVTRTADGCQVAVPLTLWTLLGTADQ